MVPSSLQMGVSGYALEIRIGILQKSTYSRGFFLGPGFPRCLGTPSAPTAFAADRFTPFFLSPSEGGAMDPGAGVPSACGVAAFESDALSPLVAAGWGEGDFDFAGMDFGDSLMSSDSGTGDASIPNASRSLAGSTTSFAQ